MRLGLKLILAASCALSSFQAFGVDCAEKVREGAQYKFEQTRHKGGYFYGTIRFNLVSGDRFAGEVIYTSHGSTRDYFTGFYSHDEITFNRPCPTCWDPPGEQTWRLYCIQDGMKGTFGPGGGEMRVD